jgi:hypothetical protein
MKKFINKFLCVKTLTIRKFKDPLNPGNLIEKDGNTFVVLHQFRRGFFTIYTVTPISLSRFCIINHVKTSFVRTVYSLGLVCKATDLNA